MRTAGDGLQTLVAALRAHGGTAAELIDDPR